MEHLTAITVEDLQQALDSADEKTPTQRLIVAIPYKNGVTQTELAEWFDVERKTIYNWLIRLEDLLIVLDVGPYFQSSKATDLVEQEEIDFVRLPPYLPELNPVEECWRQLKQRLRNRFFETQDE